MDKPIFPAWERAFPRKKTPCEVWEHQIKEIADLEMRSRVFPATLTPAHMLSFR